MMMKTKIAATCAAAAMVVTMGAANAQMSRMPHMDDGAMAPSGSAMAPSGSAMAPSGSAMTPSYPSAPPQTTGGSMMMPDSAMTTTQTTQQTSSYGADDYAADSGTLPNTGGEPLLMMMAGTLLAGSAFAMRRKLS